MSLIKKNHNIIEIDISGANGNALCIAHHLDTFLGKAKGLEFVLENTYLTSVAKLCYLYSGFNIFHDLSDDNLLIVKQKMEILKIQDDKEMAIEKAKLTIPHPGVFKPTLQL